MALNKGKGRKALQRRRQTALDNLLAGTKQPSKRRVRTEEQRLKEIETLQARVKAG